MSFRLVAGAVLLSLAIAGCLLLGTVGWFAIGFGMLTACTNDYSCTSNGCPPCAGVEHWLTAGAVAQWALAGLGGVLLFVGLRGRQSLRLVIGTIAIVAASATVVVGTTWRASESYCQPGTPGYADSYCSTGSTG